MPQAICAASIAIVPEPQHGSCKAPPASGVPRQPAAASIAAASVSFSGASPWSSRQPRLNSGSPELSTYSVARSGPRCSSSGSSGCRVSTLGAFAGRVAQQVADRVLDAQRGEVQAAQRAVLRGGVDAQGLPRRDPLRPGDRARQRVEVVLVVVAALADLDQHALRQPAFEIEPHHLERAAVDADAAALQPPRGLGQQPRDLVGQQAFDAGGARQEQRGKGGGHRQVFSGQWRRYSHCPRHCPREAMVVDAPADAPPRQLVVCCDGTANTLTAGSHDTNVLRVYEHLKRHAAPQCLLHYDPGVGAPVGAPPTDPADWLARGFARLSGLASGRGVYDNISEAYRFLMRHYRSAGDQIYLFGFSRGAFTVRCVSGLVNLFGIIRPEHEVLLPTLIRVYFSLPDAETRRCGALQEATRALHRSLALQPVVGRAALAQQIRADFTAAPGRDAWVHWVGVWDTVESVGLPGPLSRSNPSTATLRGKRIRHVRQALAFDEHRWSFAPRLYTEPGDIAGAAQSLQQRWFPGAHIDLGGGEAPGEAALADAALAWIFDEAIAVGLQVPAIANRALPALRHDELWRMPWWALGGMVLRDMRPTTPQGVPIAVIAGPTVAGPVVSVWTRRRPLAPLLLAVLFGALCLLLAGACLLSDGWRDLLQPHGWSDAAAAAAAFAWAQFASLGGRGLLGAGWPIPQQPAWAIFWGFGFTACWGYWLARIGSRAFAWLAGARRPGAAQPWWRALGMMPLLAVGGALAAGLATLAALALRALGTDLLAAALLWLAGVAVSAQLVGLLGCVPLLAVRLWLALVARGGEGRFDRFEPVP